MTSPIVELNSTSLGGWTPTESGVVDIAAGEVVSVRLADPSGVGVWFISLRGGDGTVVAPSVTQAPTASGTASFTAPATPSTGWSLIFQSQIGVNSLGKDVNGQTQSAFTTGFKVSLPTSTGNRLIAVNETTEGDPVNGWISPINIAIANPASASTTTINTVRVPWKGAARAVSTSNITLSGAQSIDGVACIAADRVLVAGQTAAKDNGIYIVASGVWSRAADMASSADTIPGSRVHVSEGTLYANSEWVLITQGAITLGATSLSFREDMNPADLRWFGGKPDVELLAAIVTHSNTTIQITGRNYTTADIGKLICIDGVGAAASTLKTTITGGTPSTTTYTIASPALLSATNPGAIGTNNDTAISAGLASGGHLLIPDGSFAFASTITIPAKFRISGNGDSSTLYQFGSGAGIQGLDYAHKLENVRLISVNSNSTIGIRAASTYDVTYGQITIYGCAADGVYQQGYSVAGVSIESNAPDAVNPGLNSAFTWLPGLVVHGCAGHAVRAGDDVFDGGGVSIFTVGPRARLQGNQGYAVYCFEGSQTHLTIRDSDCEGNVLGGIKIEECGRAEITNNHFEMLSTAQNAIQIGKTGRICANIRIGGNYIAGTTHNPFYGIEFVGGTGAFGVLIEPNYFLCTGLYGKSCVRFQTACVGLTYHKQYISGGFTADTGTIPWATTQLEDYSAVSDYWTQDRNKITQISQPAVSFTQPWIGYQLGHYESATVGAQKYSPVFSMLGSGWKTNATAGSQVVEGGWQLRAAQGTANPHAYGVWISKVNARGDDTAWTNPAIEFWKQGVSIGATGGSVSVWGGAEGVLRIPSATVVPLSTSPYYPDSPLLYTDPTRHTLRVVSDTAYVEDVAARMSVTPAQGSAERQKFAEIAKVINNATPDATTLLDIDIGALHPRSVGEIDLLIVAEDTATPFAAAKYRWRIPFKVSTSGTVTLLGNESVGTDRDGITLASVPTITASAGHVLVKVTGKVGVTVMFGCFADMPIFGPVV